MQKECAACGNLISVNPNESEKQRKGRKYCSHTCAIRARIKPVSDRLKNYYVDGLGCWIWMGALNNKGYGQISVGGKSELAHRIMYANTIGMLTPQIVLRHRCDNPRCVNPEHLEPGTKADNSQDMLRRGRAAHQSKKDWQARKLSDQDVADIYISKKSGKYLAEKFSISQSIISGIRNGRVWSHITEKIHVHPITRFANYPNRAHTHEKSLGRKDPAAPTPSAGTGGDTDRQPISVGASTPVSNTDDLKAGAHG